LFLQLSQIQSWRYKMTTVVKTNVTTAQQYQDALEKSAIMPAANDVQDAIDKVTTLPDSAALTASLGDLATAASAADGKAVAAQADATNAKTETERLKLVKPTAQVTDIAAAVAIAEAGAVLVGGTVKLINGASYQLIDAGSSGARPANSAANKHVSGGSGGLYLSNQTFVKTIALSDFISASADTDTAITYLNDYCAGLISAVNPSAVTEFGLIKSGCRVVIDGQYSFSNTLIIWPSIEYQFSKGAILTATANGQVVARTPTRAEYVAALGVNYYDRKGVTIKGRGIIDCANKASIGLLLDTCASGSNIDINVARATYRKYTTTCNKTNANDTVTFASTTNVSVFDTVEIGSDTGKFYTIVSIAGLSVKLDRGVVGTNASATVQHRAVGISYHMCQQGNYTSYVTDCDIAETYSRNVDEIECTDMTLAGENRRSNIAMLLLGISESKGKKSCLRSFGTDIFSCAGDGNDLKLYIESKTDSEADTDIPPTGGAAVTSTTLQTFPMIDVLNTCKGLTLDIIYPMNATTTTWRRLIRNKGQDTQVQKVTTRSENRPENPSRSGDYAFAEQDSAAGQLSFYNLSGPLNLSTISEKLVVTESGTRPANSRASWSSISNSRPTFSVENQIFFCSNVGARVQEFRNAGESFSRCAVGSGGVFLGDGTANPVRALQFNNGLQINMNTNIVNTKFIRMQQPNGVYQFLWFDNSGVMRHSSTEPTDRNADGTAV